jgi:hypothetical protein
MSQLHIYLMIALISGAAFVLMFRLSSRLK